MEQVTPRRGNPKLTIIIKSLQSSHTSKSKYLLALHSCTDSFGIAIKEIENPETTIQSEVFNIGRSLSNKIFSCIERVLPREFWKQIVRISVAKGPGSYTSTRLSVSMARIIAQQVNCSLDSISSFHLMAPRLYKDLHQNQRFDPFWIKDNLPRRGVIAGQYKLIKIHQESNFYEYSELISPKLIVNEKDIYPSIEVSKNIKKDIIALINFSQYCQDKSFNSDWKETLPIYPTSPIDYKRL